METDSESVFFVYCCDNLNTFHFDNTVFQTFLEAKCFCDEYVKDATPYNNTDVPNTNSHFHLEVYEMSVLNTDETSYTAVYRTNEYYYK